MIVTDNTFDQTVKDNNLILIDFWADWCGPCKKVSPILDEIENEFNLKVGKVNVDENLKTSEKFSITSIPTMILFKDGLPVHTITGAKPKHIMVKELESWI